MTFCILVFIPIVVNSSGTYDDFLLFLFSHDRQPALTVCLTDLQHYNDVSYLWSSFMIVDLSWTLTKKPWGFWCLFAVLAFSLSQHRHLCLCIPLSSRGHGDMDRGNLVWTYASRGGDMPWGQLSPVVTDNL
jgi:hypothetical protein